MNVIRGGAKFWEWQSLEILGKFSKISNKLVEILKIKVKIF